MRHPNVRINGVTHEIFNWATQRTRCGVFFRCPALDNSTTWLIPRPHEGVWVDAEVDCMACLAENPG